MASPLRIGALIHFNELGFHILHTDIDVLDDPDDRMWDDRLGNETVIDRIWKNDTFDETPAVDMDWVENRTNRHPVIPHAVIGCHCSGASTGVARVIALEYVPVVSMSSTSQLSDDDDFKNFFLTVAPDDARGQVGALVALFRSLGWDRVSVICTDTHYSRDMITKSGEAWVGNHSATPEEGGNAWTRTTIAYSHTISLQGNGDFSDESVLLGLKGMRTKKPLVKSPIIVAMATPDHASCIQGLATQTHFQPDTIWNASGGWVNYAWNAPSLPLRTGNLGLTPFHSPHFLKYQAFLDRYNSYEVMVAHGAEYKLPAHTDLRALFLLSVCGRDNGTAVVDNLCNTNFTGVSGRDPFDKNGRFRTNPQYEFRSLQQVGWQTTPLNWTKCSFVHSALDDAPGVSTPIWIFIVLPIMASLITALSITYLLDRKNKHEMKKVLEAIFNIGEQLANINARIEDARNYQNILPPEREPLQEVQVPDTWSTSAGLVIEVLPEYEEYWSVTRKLRKSMEDAWISKLWRVQNKELWDYYSFHKNRFAMNGIDDTELDVWHGTSSLEPSVIYSDKHDGFMMQYSRKGFWGWGLYFATKSSYSHTFAFKPDENSTRYSDEREMILAKLLVGNAVEMNRDESPTKKAECSALTVPPIHPRPGMKYNTVTGWTGGSHIWVVYENGRAYPNYLVRYYRGERDPARTPYKCKEDVARLVAPPLWQRGSFPSEEGSNTSTADDDKTFVWEYEDDGWHPIASQSQAIVESAYRAYTNDVSPLSTQRFKGKMWTYEIDFDTMIQINVSHPRHRQRKVRRREVDVDVQPP